MFVCAFCKISFFDKYRKRKFCSLKCVTDFHRPKAGKKIYCFVCHKSLYKPKSHLKNKNYCSRSCRSSEVVKTCGFKKYAPFYGNNRYKRIMVDGKRKYEHRHIFEMFLKRPLENHEFIHHVNENPHDNRLENLCILTIEDHGKIHKKPRK